MLQSNSLPLVQSWLDNNIADANTQLSGVIPDYTGAIYRRASVIKDQLDAALFGIAAGGINARMSVLTSVITYLTALNNDLTLEYQRNANQLEELRISGDIDRAIATLKGILQNNLAGVEGQMDVDLANLEAQKALQLVITLLPIERGGKLQLASAKGVSDLQMAQLEHSVDVQLAGIEGINKVTIAGIDADATLAESSVERQSIIASNMVEIGGIIQEATQDANFTLRTAIVEKGLKAQSSVIETSYIGIVSAADVGTAKTISNLETDAINLLAAQDATNIVTLATVGASNTKLIATNEAIAEKQVIDITNAMDLNSVVREGAYRILNINANTGAEVLTITADAQNEAYAIGIEAKGRVFAIGAESTVDIKGVSQKGNAERTYMILAAQAESILTHKLVLADISYDAQILAIESAGKYAVAGVEINGKYSIARSEALIVGQESRIKSNNRIALSNTKIAADKAINIVDINATKAEASAALQAASAITSLKIAGSTSETNVKIAAHRQITNLSIVNEGKKSLLRFDAISREANIKKSGMDSRYQYSATLRQKESSWSNLYTRTVADASYSSVKKAADISYDVGISIAHDSKNVADVTSTYINGLALTMASRKNIHAEVLANAGRNRKQTHYVYKNRSAGTTLFQEINAVRFDYATYALDFGTFSNDKAVIDTDPQIPLVQKLTFT